jgi:hypothetical protein
MTKKYGHAPVMIAISVTPESSGQEYERSYLATRENQRRVPTWYSDMITLNF